MVTCGALGTFFGPLALVALHVTANLIWIGSIASTGWLLTRATRAHDAGDSERAKLIGEIAYGLLYQKVANPAFMASFSFGIARVLWSPSTYSHAHWFHGKMAFVLAIIAVHHVLGSRARKLSAGSMQAGQVGAILTGILLGCSLMAVVFVTFQSLLVP